jgi:hypothetical protein
MVCGLARAVPFVMPVFYGGEEDAVLVSLPSVEWSHHQCLHLARPSMLFHRVHDYSWQQSTLKSQEATLVRNSHTSLISQLIFITCVSVQSTMGILLHNSQISAHLCAINHNSLQFMDQQIGVSLILITIVGLVLILTQHVSLCRILV